MWNILIALVQSLISLRGTFLGEDETISLLHPEGKKSCEILLFMHIFWYLSFFFWFNGCGGGIDLYKWVMNYCPSKEPKQIRSHGSIREKCTSKCKRVVTKFMMNISICFKLPRIPKHIFVNDFYLNSEKWLNHIIRSRWHFHDMQFIAIFYLYFIQVI